MADLIELTKWCEGQAKRMHIPFNYEERMLSIAAALRELEQDARRWKERAAALVDIYFDGIENEYETRMYAPGALREEMAQCRAALDAEHK